MRPARRAVTRLVLAASLGAVAISAAGCDVPPVCEERGAEGAEGGEAECAVLNHPPEQLAIRITPENNFFLVGRRLEFRGTAIDPDGDDLYFEWDFDSDGETDRARSVESGEGLQVSPPVDHRFDSRGRPTITLTVTDFPGLPGGEGRSTVTRSVLILTNQEYAGDRPPVASFTATPNPAGLGERIAFDASASVDPDPDQVIVGYEWDFDQERFGDEVVETDPFTTWSFDTPGEHPVSLHVVSELGGDAAVSHMTQTVNVLAESPPDAALTADPNPALPGQLVTFDASGSTDFDGTIVAYEFDLDGDNEFESSTSQPTATRTYSAPGTFPVRVRVTDDDGRTDVAQVTMRVEGGERSGGRRASRAAVQPRGGNRGVAELPFSVSFERRSLRAHLLGLLGKAKPAERSLRSFLRGRWRSRIRARTDAASGELRAKGIALATGRGKKRPRLCLRLRGTAVPGAAVSGRFRILGGTGAGGRLRGGGSFRAVRNADGSTGAVGEVRASQGARRGLPRRCSRL